MELVVCLLLRMHLMLASFHHWRCLSVQSVETSFSRKFMDFQLSFLHFFFFFFLFILYKLVLGWVTISSVFFFILHYCKFYRKAGRTKHLNRCQATGHFERGDIAAFVCNVCNYVSSSSRGLSQHKSRGSKCQDRSASMSRLELSTTTVGRSLI